MIESALYTRLTTYAPLTALISTRTYPVVAPQGTTLPYCVYRKVSPGRRYTMDGYAGIQRPRMQVSCYGATYGQAKGVAAQLIAAVESWAGVESAWVENEVDFYDKDTNTYHVPVDFFAWYK